MKSFPWSGIEGKRNGKPLLARLREVPKTAPHRKKLKQLLVVEVPYETDDKTELPAPSFYKFLRTFERQVLDMLEQKKIGLLVFSETCAGTVRQFVYVASIDSAVSSMEPVLLKHSDIRLSGTDDPDWREYERLAGIAT